MMTLVYIFIGGGLGSLTRYGVSQISNHFFSIQLPIATFISNIVSCIFLASVLFVFQEKVNQSTWINPLLLIGFCGGFSTFSTFSNETVQLVINGQWIWAIANVFISIFTAFAIIYWIRMKFIH